MRTEKGHMGQILNFSSLLNTHGSMGQAISIFNHFSGPLSLSILTSTHNPIWESYWHLRGGINYFKVEYY
jgi:hypothetical protein